MGGGHPPFSSDWSPNDKPLETGGAEAVGKGTAAGQMSRCTKQEPGLAQPGKPAVTVRVVMGSAMGNVVSHHHFPS